MAMITTYQVAAERRDPEEMQNSVACHLSLHFLL